MDVFQNSSQSKRADQRCQQGTQAVDKGSRRNIKSGYFPRGHLAPIIKYDRFLHSKLGLPFSVLLQQPAPKRRDLHCDRGIRNHADGEHQVTSSQLIPAPHTRDGPHAGKGVHGRIPACVRCSPYQPLAGADLIFKQEILYSDLLGRGNDYSP